LAGRIANIYQAEIGAVQRFFVALQLVNLDKLDKFAEKKSAQITQFWPQIVKKRSARFGI